MKKNIKKYGYLILLLLLLVSFVIPKTGPYALVNVFCHNMVLFFGSYFILRDYRSKKGNTQVFYVILICFVCANLLVNKNLVLDVIQGPKTIVLHDVSYGVRHSPLKTIGTKYTIVGTDASGKNVHIRIQGNDYNKRKDNVSKTETLTYYEHTKRLYKF